MSNRTRAEAFLIWACHLGESKQETKEEVFLLVSKIMGKGIHMGLKLVKRSALCANITSLILEGQRMIDKTCQRSNP